MKFLCGVLFSQSIPYASLSHIRIIVMPLNILSVAEVLVENIFEKMNKKNCVFFSRNDNENDVISFTLHIYTPDKWAITHTHTHEYTTETMLFVQPMSSMVALMVDTAWTHAKDNDEYSRKKKLFFFEKLRRRVLPVQSKRNRKNAARVNAWKIFGYNEISLFCGVVRRRPGRYTHTDTDTA